MTRRHNISTLLFGGAVLVCAAITGSLIGGVGGESPEAIANFREPPTITVTRTVPTPRSSLPPDVTSTPTFTPADPIRTPVADPPPPIATSEKAVATAAPATPAPEPTAAATEATFVVYTVQRGDILYTLARRFGTTESAIIALNPAIKPEALRVGQLLRIPR